LCGFGYEMRIQAYGSGFRPGFVSEDSLWVRAFALASGIRFGFQGFVWTFGKALRMQECAIVWGLCSLQESQEKSGSARNHCKVSVKESVPGGRKVFVFPLLALELTREGETHTDFYKSAMARRRKWRKWRWMIGV